MVRSRMESYSTSMTMRISSRRSANGNGADLFTRSREPFSEWHPWFYQAPDSQDTSHLKHDKIWNKLILLCHGLTALIRHGKKSTQNTKGKNTNLIPEGFGTGIFSVSGSGPLKSTHHGSGKSFLSQTGSFLTGSIQTARN